MGRPAAEGGAPARRAGGAPLIHKRSNRQRPEPEESGRSRSDVVADCTLDSLLGAIRQREASHSINNHAAVCHFDRLGQCDDVWIACSDCYTDDLISHDGRMPGQWLLG